MDLIVARIEEIDDACTTLIMRGLNRQVTREMVARMLHFGCNGVVFSFGTAFSITMLSHLRVARSKTKPSRKCEKFQQLRSSNKSCS